MRGYVYILSNKKDGTLYIGVTSNLAKRVFEHKSSYVSSFTSKYKIKNLVYYEVYENIEDAIKREKQLKKWNRSWKIELIENFNLNWHDLYEGITH